MPAGPPAPAPAKGSNGLAVAGFVLGLIGLLMSWIPVVNFLGILLGGIGLVLAVIGLVQAKKRNAGKGLAIAGIVLGGLAIIIAIVVNVAVVNAVDSALKDVTDTSVDTSGASSDESSGDGSKSGDDVGTSRDNPAPLGSSVSGGDWTVTINSVTTAEEDSIGQKPQAGSALLVINLTATYDGDDPQGESAWATVKYVDPTGKAHDTTSGSTYFMEDDAFDSLTKVYEGSSITGEQMIEIPADNWKDGVLAVSPAMLSDDTFVAVK